MGSVRAASPGLKGGALGKLYPFRDKIAMAEWTRGLEEINLRGSPGEGFKTTGERLA
ncbi:MAG: hypothetical protein OEW12_07290 [Deltaproteobacteria bacterium]|nr:hypothetical protein [Deltaproteobacteria bacterium]